MLWKIFICKTVETLGKFVAFREFEPRLRDDTIECMKAIMLRVGEAITGLHVGVTVKHIVRWPHCLGDVRNRTDSASTMWHDVKALLPELRQRSGANAP